MSTAEVAIPPEVAPNYRISVLASGLRRMWRATAVALPVIVVNAPVQGLLVPPTQGAVTPLVLSSSWRRATPAGSDPARSCWRWWLTGLPALYLNGAAND